MEITGTTQKLRKFYSTNSNGVFKPTVYHQLREKKATLQSCIPNRKFEEVRVRTLASHTRMHCVCTRKLAVAANRILFINFHADGTTIARSGAHSVCHATTI